MTHDDERRPVAPGAAPVEMSGRDKTSIARTPDAQELSLSNLSAEVVHSALTAAAARVLTDEIRQALRTGHELIIRAYIGQAWTALGYASWDAYCSGEFAEARMVRLDREQRREIVAEMSDAGMSTRAIASGLGTDHVTVSRDIRAGVAYATPASAPQMITGLDGKTYVRTAAAPQGAEPAAGRHASQRVAGIAAAWAEREQVAGEAPEATPQITPRRRRRPLPDAFRDATYDLGKAVERLQRLVKDDRFGTHRQHLAGGDLNDLIRCAQLLNQVIETVAFGSDREVRDYVRAMYTLTTEEFEEVLAEAKAEGDLSQTNLTAKAKARTGGGAR